MVISNMKIAVVIKADFTPYKNIQAHYTLRRSLILHSLAKIEVINQIRTFLKILGIFILVKTGLSKDGCIG